jgi:hypothetical protein
MFVSYPGGQFLAGNDSDFGQHSSELSEDQIIFPSYDDVGYFGRAEPGTAAEPSKR